MTIEEREAAEQKSAVIEQLQRDITEDEANGLPLDLLNKTVPVSFGADQYDEYVCVPEVRVGQLFSAFSEHTEAPEKGSGGFIPGAINGGREKEHIVEISALPYDIDGGISYEALKRRCDETGYLHCGYTTYSHRKTTSKIKVPGKDVLTDEEARGYCASSVRHAHLQNVHVLHGGKKQKRRVKKAKKRVDDYYFEISHDPVEKFRVVFVLNEPIPIGEVGAEGFAAIYFAFGDRVFGGRVYDEAGSRITQPSFLPTKPKGSTVEHTSWNLWGEPLVWRPIWNECKVRLDAEREAREKRAAQRREVQLHTTSDEKLRQIAECLEVIPADVPYPVWRKIACIVVHETGGSDEGWTLFHTWSEQSVQYTFEETEKLLDGIDEDHPNPAKIGSLIKLAHQFKPGFFPQVRASAPVINPPRNFSPLW